MASSCEWVIVSSEPVAPSSAIRFAAPPWNWSCGGP